MADVNEKPDRFRSCACAGIRIDVYMILWGYGGQTVEDETVRGKRDAETGSLPKANIVLPVGNSESMREWNEIIRLLTEN